MSAPRRPGGDDKPRRPSARPRPQAERAARPARPARRDATPGIAPDGGAARPARARKDGKAASGGDAAGGKAPREARAGRTTPSSRPKPSPHPSSPGARPAAKAPRIRKDGSAAVRRGPNSAPREPQRIAKLLARAGVASRREIERMIADGRIALDGRTLDTPATVLPSLAGVTVDGQPVAPPAETRLFLFHKPTGFLTTERDPKGRPTIYDRLPKDLPRLMPVGRLDMNTEGLLLLTTDGELKRRLELPASGIPRVYRARAYGPVTQDQLEELADGVTIDGVRYGPIDANMERRTGRNLWIEVKITEGKNREVRRVLEYLGLQVSRLIRVAYGPFLLGDLPSGGIGEVKQHDLVAFRKTLK